MMDRARIATAALTVAAFLPSAAAAEMIGTSLPQSNLISPFECGKGVSGNITTVIPEPASGSGVTYTFPTAGTIESANVQMGNALGCYDHNGDFQPDRETVVFDSYLLKVVRTSGSAYRFLTASNHFSVDAGNHVTKVKGLSIAVGKDDQLALSNSDNEKTYPVVFQTANSNDVVMAAESNRGHFGQLDINQALHGYQVAVNAEFIPKILPKFYTPRRDSRDSSLLKFSFKQTGKVKKTEFALYRKEGKSECFYLNAYRLRRGSFADSAKKCTFEGKRKWFKTSIRGGRGTFKLKQPKRGVYFVALRTTDRSNYRTKTFKNKRNVLKVVVV